MANTTKKGKASRRLDKNRLTLRKGETQRKDGTYDFRWTSADGKRHSVYAATLQELREKEEEIIRDKQDGIKTEIRRTTVNDVFELWCDLKRGLKHNTFTNYKVIQDVLGHADISTTMDIYVDVTKDMKQKEFNVLGEYFGKIAV